MKIITFYILVLLAISSQLSAQPLDTLLRLGAENNPSLKASYHSFEAAMKRVSQVNSLPEPTLSFGYFISPIETRVGAQRAKISLMQMFPWFGTLKHKEEAVHRLAESQYQEFLDEKNQLFLQIKKAYYPLREVQEAIYWQNENLHILQQYKQLATTAFANGKSAMSDVLRVDIMIEDIVTDIALLEDKKRPFTIQINRLLNRPDTIQLWFEDSLTVYDVSQFLSQDSIMLNNPQLQSLHLKMQAMQHRELESKKNGAPKIGIGIDYAIVSKRDDMNVPNNGKDAIMPMVTMSLPIFRKNYKAATEEAQMLQVAYQYKIEGLQNQLVSQYESTLYEIEKAITLNELYDKQIARTEQVIQLLYSSYSNSGKEFEEVLRTQQQLIKYQLAKATNTTQFYLALAQLDYITAKPE